jgi:alpha-1,6-mannosyltransferase
MMSFWKKEHFFQGLLLISSLIVLLTSLMSFYLSALFNTSNDQDFFFKKSDLGILTITQFTVMAMGMLGAWIACIKLPNAKHYVLIAVIAVTCRLLLLGVDHYTSNDVDRYLFDGRVAVLGFDPYVVNHQNTELQKEVALWQPPEEHRKYATLYPPLALGLFGLAAATGIDNAKLTWKLLVLVASLLVLLFSFLTLKKLHSLQHFPLVSFSPLLILEAGVGLHLDIFSALAIAIAIYVWITHRWLLTSIFLGLGALIKLIPILCLLPLVLVQSNIKNAIKLVLPGIITLVVGYGIALFMGLKPVGSLGVFFEKWRSGSPLFLWLDSQFTVWQSLSISLSLAIISFLAIAIIVYVKRKNVDIKLLAYTMQASLAIPLLISPVIFPWYLMPLIPLLALAPNVPVLIWSIALPTLYEVLGQFVCCQHWSPAAWPTYFIGVVYLAGAVYMRATTRMLYVSKL